MQLINNHFQLSGGVNPLDLVSEYGAPLYVYDANAIEEQYNRMINAFNVHNLQINYACKALPNVSIMKFLKGLGSGLDTVSIQEVLMGLAVGFEPQQILYTPNCVSLHEIEEAAKLGVRINIDNISILEQFGQKHPEKPISIRINPHIMAGGNAKTSVGHIDSKFGISFHQMPLVRRIVEATGIKVEGLHMHTGSGILDADVFLTGAEILLNIASDYDYLEFIDFGSGFKVPYKEGDAETDIEELGLKLSERFNAFCKEYGKSLTLMFEPGKFLVSKSGYFFVPVNVIKQTTSTVFAGVDSGLNHLIRPMFYDAYHEITNVSNPLGKKRFYTVVGYICETDTFGANRLISEIHEGDVLCLHDAGAYCSSMASNYNSRFRPAEAMVYQGQSYLIRKRETMEDLLRNQVEVDVFSETTV